MTWNQNLNFETNLSSFKFLMSKNPIPFKVYFTLELVWKITVQNEGIYLLIVIMYESVANLVNLSVSWFHLKWFLCRINEFQGIEVVKECIPCSCTWFFQYWFIKITLHIIRDISSLDILYFKEGLYRSRYSLSSLKALPLVRDGTSDSLLTIEVNPLKIEIRMI